GTIFLDEVAEMPIATQARLLRVLESGEFLKVGSSKVQKTDVRVVAASNVNIQQAIEKAKFREDLYYRLNTVPILVPPLRDRKPDIHLLFRKFAADFAAKYRMPVIKLDTEAEQLLTSYYWQGNVRQLKNITEQISVIEKSRDINAETLQKYLPPQPGSSLPMVIRGEGGTNEFSERDILYKVLFDMKKDLTDLKKVVIDLLENGPNTGNEFHPENQHIIQKIYQDVDPEKKPHRIEYEPIPIHKQAPEELQEHVVLEEKSLSLQDLEQEMIRKALKKHEGRRKNAAKELGISERTLYRKLHEYGIENEG
ncbi:MAG TPA: sigma 54-interacting transcriptional regulator, partial [Bacteroidia bacterium]|nr:sigma 54-interacting transcriptional regulator [Bacteroidia bacterium]